MMNKQAMKLPVFALLIKSQFAKTLAIVKIGMTMKFNNASDPWINLDHRI
jgi:hypothetical protein